MLAQRARLATAIVVAVMALSAEALAQAPAPEDATRYAALGDSIAAGFKAQPATQGYAFLLYQNGVFDRVPRTLFNNLAAVGATSQDVLLYQVPLALIPGSRGGFQPDYVTLTVGGNDLTAIQRYAATGPTPLELQTFIAQTITAYGLNLGGIFQALTTALPNVTIFVGNQYSVPELEDVLPGAEQVLALFNATTAAAAAPFSSRVHVVDVYSAFADRQGLLLIDRHGASAFEVHLTNAGHRAMAEAFADVIAEHE